MTQGTEENTDKCLEVEERGNVRLTDEQAKAIIELCLDCQTVAEFQALPKVKQENFIEEFRNKGLSVSQTVRLTGISKGLVEKWLK